MAGCCLERCVPARKMAPPSSVKRMKSKDAVVVAAVVKKPKRSVNSVSSGEMRAAQAEQLPSTTEVDAESVDVASAQKAKSKTKLSKSERALKKAKKALARTEAQVEADRISIKKKNQSDRRASTAGARSRCQDAEGESTLPPSPLHARAPCTGTVGSSLVSI